MAFACALFAAFDLNSQTLDLPPRSANAASGSEFANRISSMSLADRENAVYAEIASGNVPDFLRNLVAITTNATISGISHTITYYVTPDYLAIGSDEDYFLQPMTPLLGQRLADLLHCSMPTRKMVNDIWTKAPVKLAPAPIPPSAAMISVPVFIEHNLMVRTQRLQQIATYPLGALVSGDKKDVVISNEIYNRPPPPRVVILWLALPEWKSHPAAFRRSRRNLRRLQPRRSPRADEPDGRWRCEHGNQRSHESQSGAAAE